MKPQRTSLFLMANLGAEVARLISATEKLEKKHIEEAVERSEKIIRELKSLPDMKKREHELDLLSLSIRNIAAPESILRISRQHLQSYFTPFAVRVQSHE